MRDIYWGSSRPSYKAKPFPFVSWLIRLVETPVKDFLKGKIHSSSHYWAWFRNEQYLGFGEISEAAGSHVRLVPDYAFKDQVVITKLFKMAVPDEAYKTAVIYSRAMNFVKYALGENIGILVVRFLLVFGYRIKNPFGRGSKAQKCTELILNTIILSRGLDYDQIRSAVQIMLKYKLPKDKDTLGGYDLDKVSEYMVLAKYAKEVDINEFKKQAEMPEQVKSWLKKP